MKRKMKRIEIILTVIGSLVMAAFLAAVATCWLGCGGTPEVPPCGPGTFEFRGICLPVASEPPCGPGTIAFHGVCVSDAEDHCGAGSHWDPEVCQKNGRCGMCVANEKSPASPEINPPVKTATLLEGWKTIADNKLGGGIYGYLAGNDVGYLAGWQSIDQNVSLATINKLGAQTSPKGLVAKESWPNFAVAAAGTSFLMAADGWMERMSKNGQMIEYHLNANHADAIGSDGLTDIITSRAFKGENGCNEASCRRIQLFTSKGVPAYSLLNGYSFNTSFTTWSVGIMGHIVLVAEGRTYTNNGQSSSLLVMETYNTSNNFQSSMQILANNPNNTGMYFAGRVMPDPAHGRFLVFWGYNDGKGGIKRYVTAISTNGGIGITIETPHFYGVAVDSAGRVIGVLPDTEAGKISLCRYNAKLDLETCFEAVSIGSDKKFYYLANFLVAVSGNTAAVVYPVSDDSYYQNTEVRIAIASMPIP